MLRPATPPDAVRDDAAIGPQRRRFAPRPPAPGATALARPVRLDLAPAARGLRPRRRAGGRCPWRAHPRALLPLARAPRAPAHPADPEPQRARHRFSPAP